MRKASRVGFAALRHDAERSSEHEPSEADEVSDNRRRVLAGLDEIGFRREMHLPSLRTLLVISSRPFPSRVCRTALDSACLEGL
jgi:hypothetical protein